MTIDVIATCRELGFARAAVIPIEPARRQAEYDAWLAAGYAGDMAYLAEHAPIRANPGVLAPTARSIVVVALAYPKHDPPVPDGLVALRGRIARYARGEDYHMVLRDRLVLLAQRIGAIAARTCVDSAPMHEREWAERGGLGFIAKNTLLIAPGAGSYLVLGELLVEDELTITAPEAPPKPRCGSCRACLDACPTRAFVDAYALDARRCISYLTIEFHGSIPLELRPLIGTWIFGCDICQEVCPFNAGAGESPDPALRTRDLDHALPDLVALALMPTNQMRRFMKRTAMRRIPRPVLRRNLAIALGNTRDPAARPALEHLMLDPSELVREHAQWGLDQLT